MVQRLWWNGVAALFFSLILIDLSPVDCLAGPQNTGLQNKGPTTKKNPVVSPKTPVVKSTPLKAPTTAPVSSSASPASAASDTGRVELLDMVLASVEDEPITISDLKEFAEQQGQVIPENVLSGDPKIRQLLRDLVLTKLIEREAASSGISVSDEEVSAYVDEIKRQNGVDDQGLAKLLASKGLSFEIYKRQVRDDIFKTRVVGMHVRNKVTITDEEVKRQIAGEKSDVDENGEPAVDDEEKPAGVRLFQIRLPKDEALGGDAKETAEKMRGQLAGGDNWPKVGNQHFTDLGIVVITDLRPELAEAAEELAENEISPVIETPDAVYLLMKPNAESAKVSSTDSLEDRIRQQLFQEKFKAALDKFLNDDLPKKYHVELKL